MLDDNPSGAIAAGGFSAADLATLEHLAAGANRSVDHDRSVDELWRKAGGLLHGLGAEIFGGASHADLWPEGDGDEGDRGPFIWGRLKRPDAVGFATHIGVFLSGGPCNLAIDLEKDLLDAGAAAETLDRFIALCDEQLGALLQEVRRDDLRVWTDSHNVIAAADFAGVDFAAFMGANRDAGHPWPKVGYLMDAGTVVGFGDAWVAELADRAAPLVGVYDAMLERLTG